MKSTLELPPPVAAGSAQRVRLALRGAVQGVGFRPFIYRLAQALGLAGWVTNSSQGVLLEVEGLPHQLNDFLLRIEREKPPRSFIQSLETSWLDPIGYQEFQIRPSDLGGPKTALVLPDIATCPDCLREISDPSNRRYRYPFTNCTHCGPRFTIIEALPYDRANTSMKAFALCPQCQAEYEDPSNRRFHAQPNACPDCGPALELWENDAGNIAGGADMAPASRACGHDALRSAAAAIRQGKIVAVKGIGGFHLLVDARNEAAVLRLRERKHREEKPFALMVPSLESVKACCEVSSQEERLLQSPEAPLVLLKRRLSAEVQLAASVAAGNPNLAVMLPSNPIHHLLMAELNCPVVATSGNLSDEPICILEREARQRLAGLADLFLVHNRPIVRHADDSVARIILGREMILRRARGYAPLPLTLQYRNVGTPQSPILAVGAHLKNSVALGIGDRVFISQHLGDLETEQAYATFRAVISDFSRLYEADPEIVVADLHPDYLSTKFAHASGKKVLGVQHHIAHVLGCLAENETCLPALGVSWDGTGLGSDGTIWGGEFFLVTEEDVERLAHFRQFRLPGGDKAVREPRRSALGVLFELFADKAFELKNVPAVAAFSTAELIALKTMLHRRLHSPVTSSAGRLFDAVAGLLGIREKIAFEGQAAMQLEFALKGEGTTESYNLPLTVRGQALVLDWEPMVRSIMADLEGKTDLSEISAKFHNALVEGIVTVALHVGEPRVALSGGCFQNAYLTTRTVQRLRQEGFKPCWHQRVPPNDGGLSFGQIVAGRRFKL